MPCVIILNIHCSSLLICLSSSSLNIVSHIDTGSSAALTNFSSPLGSKLGKMELQMSSLITLLSGLLKSALPGLSSYLLISHLDNKVFQVAAYWFDFGVPCWAKKQNWRCTNALFFSFYPDSEGGDYEKHSSPLQGIQATSEKLNSPLSLSMLCH